MSATLTIHASFGGDCPGSDAATTYLKRRISTLDNIEFCEKITRQKISDYEYTVQFTVHAETVTTASEAEKAVDEIHYAALGRMGYENMLITANGLELD
jgi:hypothetical protein